MKPQPFHFNTTHKAILWVSAYSTTDVVATLQEEGDTEAQPFRVIGTALEVAEAIREFWGDLLPIRQVEHFLLGTGW